MYIYIYRFPSNKPSRFSSLPSMSPQFKDFISVKTFTLPTPTELQPQGTECHPLNKWWVGYPSVCRSNWTIQIPHKIPSPATWTTQVTPSRLFSLGMSWAEILSAQKKIVYVCVCVCFFFHDQVRHLFWITGNRAFFCAVVWRWESQNQHMGTYVDAEALSLQSS